MSEFKEKTLIRYKKIRLMPTKEQEEIFIKSSGVARWSYNYYLSESNKAYQRYLDRGKTGKSYVTEGEIRKYINNTLKPTTHKWLGDVGSNVMKQGVRDAGTSLNRWYKGITDKPKYRKKGKTKPSFYVNYESIKKTQKGFRGERLGEVRTTEPLPKISKGGKYSEPRITYDGLHWYLAIGYKIYTKEEYLTERYLGIDLGVSTFAVTSDGKVYPNINKSRRVRQLEKRLRREERKLSRRQEANVKSRTPEGKITYIKPLKECKNWTKQRQEVRKIHKKLRDMRTNYIHQTSTEIVKTKPKRIVMETLNVKGMLKNKRLSRAIKNQNFFAFKQQVKYKCEEMSIEFIEADRYFPSSKLCSNCGTKKEFLSLSERVYKCQECKLEIDRDLNASINLSNYEK